MGRGAHASVVQISRVRRRRIHPLSSKEDVIAWVLARSRRHSLRALMISALATVFGLVAAANLSLPAGLFMPTILYGGLLDERARSSSSERFVGQVYASIITPRAVARQPLGGTFRATVSVVVIVLEGVGKSAFLFPLLIAVASANLVSGLFGSSVYEEQLVRANIPFLHAVRRNPCRNRQRRASRARRSMRAREQS